MCNRACRNLSDFYNLLLWDIRCHLEEITLSKLHSHQIWQFLSWTIYKLIQIIWFILLFLLILFSLPFRLFCWLPILILAFLNLLFGCLLIFLPLIYWFLTNYYHSWGNLFLFKLFFFVFDWDFEEVFQEVLNLIQQFASIVYINL